MGTVQRPTALPSIIMKLLLLAACLALGDGQEMEHGNIVEELTKAGATQLVDFVVAAGLADTLAGEGPFTVVAPTNDAFAKLPAELVDMLVADTELLKKVLLHHVVSGMAVTRDMITNDALVPTVEGSIHRVNVYLKSDYYDGFITVNGKRIRTFDIHASNGVIHLMTEVIYPFIPDQSIADIVSTDPRFSTLLAAVKAAGLVDTLASAGPFTLFAPTNDAFDRVPSSTLTALLTDKEALVAVLLRHVLPETIFQKGICWETHATASGAEIATQVFKNNVAKVVSYANEVRTGARLNDYDILASNGVIHAIDNVI